MNARNLTLDTGMFALAYPRDGKLCLVLNTDRHTQKEAQTLLFDRVENNEAFPFEVVVKLCVCLQWFGQHTGGTESFPAYLVPEQIVQN